MPYPYFEERKIFVTNLGPDDPVLKYGNHNVYNFFKIFLEEIRPQVVMIPTYGGSDIDLAIACHDLSIPFDCVVAGNPSSLYRPGDALFFDWVQENCRRVYEIYHSGAISYSRMQSVNTWGLVEAHISLGKTFMVHSPSFMETMDYFNPSLPSFLDGDVINLYRAWEVFAGGKQSQESETGIRDIREHALA